MPAAGGCCEGDVDVPERDRLAPPRVRGAEPAEVACLIVGYICKEIVEKMLLYCRLENKRQKLKETRKIGSDLDRPSMKQGPVFSIPIPDANPLPHPVPSTKIKLNNTREGYCQSNLRSERGCRGGWIKATFHSSATMYGCGIVMPPA